MYIDEVVGNKSHCNINASKGGSAGVAHTEKT